MEALSDTLERIEHPDVRVNVIHRGAGRVNESDVLLAAASDGLIIAFHVVADAKAREVASREHVAIREYDVIYEVEEDIKKLLEVLNRLVDAGNTVVVIEHNMDVIKTVDYIIDLGPEGGEAGGEVVAAGMHEEVATAPRSYTGQFLKELLPLSRGRRRGRKVGL